MWQLPDSQKTAALAGLCRGWAGGRWQLLPDKPASQRSSWCFWLRRLNLICFPVLFREFLLFPSTDFRVGPLSPRSSFWTFPSLQKDLLCLPVVNPILLQPLSSCSFIIPSAPMDLSFLNVSCKWKLTVHILHIWLLSCNTIFLQFTQVECVSMCHSFLQLSNMPFYVPQCIYLSTG